MSLLLLLLAHGLLFNDKLKSQQNLHTRVEGCSELFFVILRLKFFNENRTEQPINLLNTHKLCAFIDKKVSTWGTREIFYWQAPKFKKYCFLYDEVTRRRWRQPCGNVFVEHLVEISIVSAIEGCFWGVFDTFQV